MATSKIIERIERDLGVAGLAEMLAERISLADLQSLLLEVYRQQAAQRTPARVLADHETNRFTRPSNLSPQVMLTWEQTAFSALAPDFEALDLAPVAALGTVSAVALSDQHRVMSTIYNTEVVSDSTNVLALESALRRRELLREHAKSTTPVHLAASHRLLRTQRYANANSIAHFKAFALCSAGRDTGNFRFELDAFVEHIGFYVRALRAYAGAEIALRLAVTDFRALGAHSVFIEQLFARVQEQYEDLICVVDDERTSGRDYYADLCFHVYAAAPSGDFIELADGGVVDWTQKLLSNAKERCVISGIGSERVCAEFGAKNQNR